MQCGLGRAELLHVFQDLHAGNIHGLDMVHRLHSGQAASMMAANRVDPVTAGKAIERVENESRPPTLWHGGSGKDGRLRGLGSD